MLAAPRESFYVRDMCCGYILTKRNLTIFSEIYQWSIFEIHIGRTVVIQS